MGRFPFWVAQKRVASSTAASLAAAFLFGPRSAWPVTTYVSGPVATTLLWLAQPPIAATADMVMKAQYFIFHPSLLSLWAQAPSSPSEKPRDNHPRKRSCRRGPILSCALTPCFSRGWLSDLADTLSEAVSGLKTASILHCRWHDYQASAPALAPLQTKSVGSPHYADWLLALQAKRTRRSAEVGRAGREVHSSKDAPRKKAAGNARKYEASRSTWIRCPGMRSCLHSQPRCPLCLLLFARATAASKRAWSSGAIGGRGVSSLRGPNSGPV